MPSVNVKLGKGPALIDPRTLKLENYLTDKLAPPPVAVDNTAGIKSFGMMLNGPNTYGAPIPEEGLGDCTIAACGHAEQVWSAVARKVEQTPPDSIILSKYELWCGYKAGDANSDQGGIEIKVLNHWRKTQLDYHPLKMYADPNWTNLDHIKKAIELFGGVYIGLQLPVSVQGASTWDVSEGPDAVPGSWGGHAVFVPKYRTDENGKTIFTAISWGELIDITEAFWLYTDPTIDPTQAPNSYLDEAHALVAQEFTNSWQTTDGVSPEGLDLAQMVADALAVTG